MLSISLSAETYPELQDKLKRYIDPTEPLNPAPAPQKNKPGRPPKEKAEEPAKQEEHKPAATAAPADPFNTAPAAEVVNKTLEPPKVATNTDVKAAFMALAKPRKGETTEKEGWGRVKAVLESLGYTDIKVKDIPEADSQKVLDAIAAYKG